MRLALRLNLLLIAGVAAVAMGFAYYQVRSERRGLERDLQRQALDLAESQAKAVEPSVGCAFLSQSSNDGRPLRRARALGGHDGVRPAGQPVAITSDLVARLNGKPPAILQDDGAGEAREEFIQLGGTRMHAAIVPVRTGEITIGTRGGFSRCGLYRYACRRRLAPDAGERGVPDAIDRGGHPAHRAMGSGKTDAADGAVDARAAYIFRGSRSGAAGKRRIRVLHARSLAPGDQFYGRARRR